MLNLPNRWIVLPVRLRDGIRSSPPPIHSVQIRSITAWFSLICVLTSTVLISAALPATAQIVGDRTLPRPSRTARQGRTIEITGGTRSGRNLFHSFERFSVPEGRTAFFNQANSIDHIFSRVTGSSVSQINGMIRANGNANLFLINPNGLIFGRNAVLNLGGSFIGSTADRLQFADGSEFGAVNPAQTNLLTISQPIGLRFETEDRSASGTIQVQGDGHGLFLNSPTDPAVNRDNRPVGLQVSSGETLALIGSNLSLQGGNLTARGGRLELGSVAAGSVSLTPAGSGWQLGYGEVDRFSDIQIGQASSLEASGNRGGEIQVQGRQIRITDASALLADTLGTGPGGSLSLRAHDAIEITGFSINPEGAPFVSRLSTDVAANATGSGGTLSITTPHLQIGRGAQISSGTFGAGNAGSLNVQADRIDIRGGSLVGASGLFAPVAPTASGNGGNLTVIADRLHLDAGAEIAVTTFGAGNAGRLILQADQISLAGGSGLFAQVEPGATGRGGAIQLQADRLQVREGSQIATSTAGSQQAGDLTVQAQQIVLSGTGGSFSSGLFILVAPDATGNGGNLTVTADQLSLRSGAQIATTTFGRGAAGNLAVQADQIEVIGVAANGPSALVSGSRGAGNGGNLSLHTQTLQVAGGGQIATSTAGSGNAGDLTIQADAIELTGGSAFGQSGLFASAINDTGAGGNLNITTDRFTAQEGAVVSVSNFSSSGVGSPGQGAVGNLNLTADQILLDNQARLTADSAAGDRGNITVRSNSLLLRQQSQISTNAQGTASGGNIAINTSLLAANSNSDITANATSNFGGRVTIAADAVLGIQPRSQLTPSSDITASSDLGPQFSGTIELNVPELDESPSSVLLPDRPIDDRNQIVAVCNLTEGNEFVVTGRGGLPEAPTALLGGRSVWEDLRGEGESVRVREGGSVREEGQGSRGTIAEAEGWRVNAAGEVMLVAEQVGSEQVKSAQMVAGWPCAAD